MGYESKDDYPSSEKRQTHKVRIEEKDERRRRRTKKKQKTKLNVENGRKLNL